MDTLQNTLTHVMNHYAGKALNGESFLTINQDAGIFAIVTIGESLGERIADADLIVRLVNNQIIIEKDMNDKTLMEALLQAGVPSEKITVAYLTLDRSPSRS